MAILMTVIKSHFVLSLLLGLCLCLCQLDTIEAKQFQRCELARKLLASPISYPRSLLSNWICLLEHESDLDTNKVTTNNNGSKNYGLFQINSRYCQEGRRGGVCNLKCEDLIDESIDDDAACAKHIYDKEGFQFWNGWQRWCRNPQNLPNLKVICGI